MPVVVLEDLAEQGFEVTSSEDEPPVEALSPGGAHESLGDGIRPRGPGPGLDDPDASEAKTASKDPVNFVSPSRVRNLSALACSARSTQMLHACWVTQSVIGLPGTHAIRTTRVSWRMKKST